MKMMINNYIRWIAMTTVILVTAWSCQTEEDAISVTQDQTSLSDGERERMTKLGKKLENPYSVENMQIALDNLKASNSTLRSKADEIEITTTHHYIRFINKYNNATENNVNALFAFWN
jgi:hypothetical protein